MPTYNPYAMSYNTYGASYAPQNSYMSSYQQNPAMQYMINVDGEMAARAWQMPNNLPPNTVIPLWDLDGKHVYFRSIDAFGRLNPLTKGRIIFDENSENLPNGNSGVQGLEESESSKKYITKDEFRNEIDQLKNDIRSMLQTGNQNGNVSSNHQQNRVNK